MTLAKNAAKAVLRTLTWVDFVNVIAFNNEVIMAAPHLVPATDENKARLNAWVDGLQAGGMGGWARSGRYGWMGSRREV